MTTGKTPAIGMAALALLAGCAGSAVQPVAPLPAVTVAARAETDPVGTVLKDAADDPAIWRNAADPSQSLIVGTDKKAGLYVYGLDGHKRSFIAGGALNNVDLRDNVEWAGAPVILIGASDRTDIAVPHVTLFTLDGKTGALTLIGRFATGAGGEAYGFCFGKPNQGELMAYVVTKQGKVLEMLVDGKAGRVTLHRSFGVTTQPEGCVVDDRTGQLYLGEEDVGIWRFDLRTAQPVAIPFAMVGSAAGLVADVEGLALAPEGESGGMLIASSQGDNAYALFNLADAALVGRFRIGGGTVDGTFDTDGIELALGDFGPDYPAGLFVAQDGDNMPQAQNFKLLSWQDILSTVGK